MIEIAVAIITDLQVWHVLLVFNVIGRDISQVRLTERIHHHSKDFMQTSMQACKAEACVGVLAPRAISRKWWSPAGKTAMDRSPESFKGSRHDCMSKS